MTDRLVKDRVQFEDPETGEWCIFDLDDQIVVARKKGGPWFSVRRADKPIRKRRPRSNLQEARI